jgi:hypothetical protein
MSTSAAATSSVDATATTSARSRSSDPGGKPSGSSPDGAGPAAITGGGADAAAAQSTPGPYRPKDLPAHFAGQSDQETIDRILRAYQGARADIAQFGEVPKDPTGYTFEPNDKVKEYLVADGDNALVQGALAALHKAGLREKQAPLALNELMGWLIDMNVVEPSVDIAAERQALVPDTARGLPPDEQLKMADRRIADNIAAVKALEARQLLPREAVDALLTLGDTRHGHAVFELLGRLTQEAPLAMGGTATADSEQGLDAAMQDPRYRSTSPKFDPAYRAEVDRRLKRLYGDAPRA